MKSFLRILSFVFVGTFVFTINVFFVYASNSYILQGPAELQVIDEQGKISGQENGKIIEEASGAYVRLFSEGDMNEIYAPNKGNYKIKVIGKDFGKYRLFLSNGNYFTQISDVSIVPGQVDTYTRTNDLLTIDFSNFKFGYYNLLIDNFGGKNVRSINQVYLPAIGLTQRFYIDWDKVAKNSSDSIQYRIGFLSFSLSPNGYGEVLGFFFGILTISGICFIVAIFIMRKSIYQLTKKIFFQIKNFFRKLLPSK